MIRDITIGQYYPADSVLHRLDPRVKLVGTLTFLISLFLFNNLIGYVIAGIFLATMIKISKVPFSFIVRGLKTIVILMLFTVVFNLFLTDGTVLWQWKFIKITIEGIQTAIFMALRLTFLIIGSSLMTLTGFIEDTRQICTHTVRATNTDMTPNIPRKKTNPKLNVSR